MEKERTFRHGGDESQSVSEKKIQDFVALAVVLLMAAGVSAFSIGFELFGMPKNFFRLLFAGIFVLIILILYLLGC